MHALTFAQHSFKIEVPYVHFLLSFLLVSTPPLGFVTLTVPVLTAVRCAGRHASPWVDRAVTFWGWTSAAQHQSMETADC